MLRRALLLSAVALLAAAGTGCRSRCDRHPWLSSNTRSEAPCQTVGRNSGCFDAVSGQPVPCPSGPPVGVVPGGTGVPLMPGGGTPFVLPEPRSSDMIQPPGVPATPFPAPPPGTGMLPYPGQTGTPVRGLNK